MVNRMILAVENPNEKMDLKDCIKICTKINKSQSLTNVKWSSVSKEQNQNSQHWQQSLPYHLELEKNLHDSTIEEKDEIKIQNDKDDGDLVFTEITQSLRKFNIGWDVSGIEKRYKQYQNKSAKEILNRTNSESDTSFTTAQTTTTSLAEDSFLSAIQDDHYLKIDNTDQKMSNKRNNGNVKKRALKDINQDKIMYKNNALMRGLILSSESKFVKETSTDFTITKKIDSVHGIQCEKENPNQDKNKQSKRRNRKRGNSKSRKNAVKTSQTTKQSSKSGSKQKDLSVQKKVGTTEADRKFFLDIPDECFGFYDNKKRMK